MLSGWVFLGAIFKVELLGSIVLSCSKTTVDSVVLGCGTGGPGDNWASGCFEHAPASWCCAASEFPPFCLYSYIIFSNRFFHISFICWSMPLFFEIRNLSLNSLNSRVLMPTTPILVPEQVVRIRMVICRWWHLEKVDWVRNFTQWKNLEWHLKVVHWRMHVLCG